MDMTLKLISPVEPSPAANDKVVQLANDADPLETALEGVERVELNFPKSSDGRAFSQALLLRRRRRFTGDIRATGDVLIDQLVQMQRTGFSSAVLRADQDLSYVQRQFERYPEFYQGDVLDARPRFERAA